ncbi:hypothetical protein CC2G_000325 [Coprinopsis cinerea AmutBmut pab1-1]|nr:hypothetical protein CC2G_000325 [Coprinopsis cinerea AmutBmut pab1-1]
MAKALAPKWKAALESAIAEFPKQTVLQLSTLDSQPSPFSLTVAPRVRSHIFRSFLSPPSQPNLPLIHTTTDIRTPKVDQITSNPHTPVEVAWWIEGRQQQFRIRGKAVIIGSPGDPRNGSFAHWRDVVRGAQSPGSDAANDGQSTGYLGLKSLTLSPSFDWEQQRISSFKAMSAHMKASWCRPVPGTPLEGGQEEAKKWPVRLEELTPDSSDEDKKNWQVALNNFALVIIEPVFVDLVDLAVIPNRRFFYERDEKGNWEEKEVVP